MVDLHIPKNKQLSKNLENKILFLFVLLIISEWLGNFIWQGNGIRHIYLILIAVVLLLNKRKLKFALNKQSLLLFFISIVYYFILSFYTNSLGFESFLGWGFTYLFFIVFFIISSIHNLHFDYNYVIKKVVIIIFIFSLYPFFDALINLRSMRENFGVFRDQSALASMVCIAVILSAYLEKIYNRKIWKYLIIYFVMVIFLSTMKKSILFISLFGLFSILPNAKTSSKFVYIFFFTLVIAVTSPFIYANVIQVLNYESNVDLAQHVRWGMYVGAFVLATTNFPFGSGFSTFGSLFSVYDYKTGTYVMSRTYYDLGLNNLADNESRLLNGHTTFLDTYYPHIIGEGGLIQVILILFILLHIIKLLKKRCNYTNEFKLYYSLVWIILMVFTDGVTIISPEMPVFIFFFSLVPAIIIATNYKTP